MNTDDLIRILAADGRRAIPPRRRVLAAAIAGGGVACIAFMAIVGARPDLTSAIWNPRVAFKFVFAGATAAAALRFGVKVSRPEDRTSVVTLLLPVLALLVMGAGTDAYLTPPNAWAAAALGTTPLTCVGMIVVVAILPVSALLQAMRAGAPSSPTLAGAAAGLGGGAIGAGVFALNCPNDSVLFVAIWYVLALAVTCVFGAVLGAWKLAW